MANKQEKTQQNSDVSMFAEETPTKEVASVQGLLVLRLPSKLWDVFGSPEIHVPLTFETDMHDQIINRLRDWQTQVIAPLMEEFRQQVSEQTGGNSGGLSVKQMAYGIRLGQEAGLAPDEVEKQLKNMSASEFDGFITRMKAKKEGGKTVETESVACPRCGRIQKVPANWRGTPETFVDFIAKNGCYTCRTGK